LPLATPGTLMRCEELEPPNRSANCSYDANAIHELVSSVASNGLVIATSTSAGFVHVMTDTWIAWARRSGITQRILVAEDKQSARTMERSDPGHVVHFDIASSVNTMAHAYETREYKEIVSRRAAILYRLLALNVADVLWLDSDALTISNPRPAIPTDNRCDVLTQSDSACRWPRDVQEECPPDIADPASAQLVRESDVAAHPGSQSLLCTGSHSCTEQACVLDAL
jgi:hypothetical protein